MSNYILKGTDVSVFPFGRARHNDPNARILNEQNITKIIKSITDDSSYVIKYDETNNIVEFVLNGYYFVVSVSSLFGENGLTKEDEHSIYAYIKMSESDETYKYLSGGDILSPTLTGEGTSSSPYQLSEGSYSFSLSSTSTTRIYFTYTFPENGDIVFYTQENINVEVKNGENWNQLASKKITETKDSTVEFRISLKSDPSIASGTTSFDVLYSDAKFNAIKFTDNIEESINGEEVTHSLHIFDAEYSDKDKKWVIVIPESSKRKFTASSIDVVNINCGTASDYLTGNT